MSSLSLSMFDFVLFFVAELREGEDKCSRLKVFSSDATYRTYEEGFIPSAPTHILFLCSLMFLVQCDQAGELLFILCSNYLLLY